jgi:hypothetical protein
MRVICDAKNLECRMHMYAQQDGVHESYITGLNRKEAAQRTAR